MDALCKEQMMPRERGTWPIRHNNCQKWVKSTMFDCLDTDLVFLGQTKVLFSQERPSARSTCIHSQIGRLVSQDPSQGHTLIYSIRQRTNLLRLFCVGHYEKAPRISIEEKNAAPIDRWQRPVSQSLRH